GVDVPGPKLTLVNRPGSAPPEGLGRFSGDQPRTSTLGQLTKELLACRRITKVREPRSIVVKVESKYVLISVRPMERAGRLLLKVPARSIEGDIQDAWAGGKTFPPEEFL